MRVGLAVALMAGALTACASAGGFPKSIPMDVSNAISQAQQAITEADAAGAESHAMAMISSARAHLGRAQAEQVARKGDQALLLARQALADARLARTMALRGTAERGQSDAQSALQSLPPNGGAR